MSLLLLGAGPSAPESGVALLDPMPQGLVGFPEQFEVVCGSAFDVPGNNLNEDDVVTLTHAPAVSDPPAENDSQQFWAENPAQGLTISGTNRLVFRVVFTDSYPVGPSTLVNQVNIKIQATAAASVSFYRQNQPIINDGLYTFKELFDEALARLSPPFNDFALVDGSNQTFNTTFFKSMTAI